LVEFFESLPHGSLFMAQLCSKSTMSPFH
jgi:hypothetical protein